MLLESMPKDVKVKWEGQHLKKPIPTDLAELREELQVWEACIEDSVWLWVGWELNVYHQENAEEFAVEYGE